MAELERVANHLGDFGAIGISEYVLDWPDDKDLNAFEAAAHGVLPALRLGA